jgi:hypothetical protein
MADSKLRKRRLRERRQQAGLKAALVWLSPEAQAAMAASSAMGSLNCGGWREPIRTDGTMESKGMLFDPDDFEPVWQHICACAREDHRREAFIESCKGRGGNWVRAVERDEIVVQAKSPKNPDGAPRPLRKSIFRNEWKKLTEDGHSDNVSRQAVWDMLVRYFPEDVERGPARWPLRWKGFHR